MRPNLRSERCVRRRERIDFEKSKLTNPVPEHVILYRRQSWQTVCEIAKLHGLSVNNAKHTAQIVALMEEVQ